MSKRRRRIEVIPIWPSVWIAVSATVFSLGAMWNALNAHLPVGLVLIFLPVLVVPWVALLMIWRRNRQAYEQERQRELRERERRWADYRQQAGYYHDRAREEEGW